MAAKALFALLILCLSFSPIVLAKDQFPKFGVGISLTLDYGVVSIHTHGAVTGVAKIEGTSEYKDMMGAQNCSFTRPYECSSFHHGYVISAPDQQSLQARLSNWWAGSEPITDSRSKILLPMLKELKATAEVHTKDRVNSAFVAFPFFVHQSFRDATELAGSNLSLNVTTFDRPSGYFAAQASGYTFSPSGPGAILAVDYSRAALTVTFLPADRPTYQRFGLRGMHDTRFGSDSWNRESKFKLEQELNKVAGIVSYSADSPAFGLTARPIDAFVLSGESTGDSRVREFFMELLHLDEELGSNARVGSDQYAFDRLYSVSNELAIRNSRKKLSKRKKGFFS